MPLFETLPIDRDAVADAVALHWDLELGDRLKASQNHTFAASRKGSDEKFVVRATPDPAGSQHARICDELFLLDFLGSRAGLEEVCLPVRPAAAVGSGGADGDFAVRAGSVTICAFRWARGSPVDFLSYRWISDAAVVECWGATFARLHRAAREFEVAHPERAARVRPWTAVHDGIMAPAADTLHADDRAAMDAGAPNYGVIHGDLNVSNFFLDEADGRLRLSVFDWDQVQRAWYEYDLAQALLASVMLAEAGSLPAGDPVPEAKPAEMAEAMVRGYESVAGAGSVDRERLWRMVALRKDFYGRFCSRALVEGSPPDMEWFIKYCDAWVNGPAAPR